MNGPLKRILEYRRDELKAGRDPGACFVAQSETQELARTAAEMLRHGPATEENMRLMDRMLYHAAYGNDPFVLNGLRLFGMEIQVEGSAQVAA
jgi:hypothetical protein